MSTQRAFKFFTRFQSMPSPASEKRLYQKVSEDKIVVASTLSKVWRFLANPDLMPLWSEEVRTAQLAPVRSEKSVGRLKTVYRKDGDLQQWLITEWTPEKSMAYITLKPKNSREAFISVHFGKFILRSTQQGVEVTWQNYFEFPETFQNILSVQKMISQYRRNLIHLKWRLESSLSSAV